MLRTAWPGLTAVGIEHGCIDLSAAFALSTLSNQSFPALLIALALASRNPGTGC